MKKTLTLLVMFLATWGILCAQTSVKPVFGYQAVVRTSDNNLVESTPVVVTISAYNGDNVMFSEIHENMTTDALGMISLLVGTGDLISGDIEEVDWTAAELRIDVQIDGGETVEVVSDVAAAPLALKAGKTILTTERIVEYVQNPNTTIEDYGECMTALGQNIPEEGLMWQKTRTRIINYMKNHRDIAREVMVHYLSTATADDVDWFYDQVKGTEAMNEAIDVFAQFAMDHRAFATEIFIAYLELMTPAEVEEGYNVVVENHDADIEYYVVQFAKENRDLAFRMAKAFFETATANEVTEALQNFNSSSMKTKLIDELFYNHLDNYIQPNNNLTDDQIQARVKAKMDDQNYLKKEQCDGEDVDICTMRDHVNELMGD